MLQKTALTSIEAAELSVQYLLHFIGENPGREGLIHTPKRVVKSFQKLFSGYGKDPAKLLTTFSREHYDEMIVLKDISFFSVCEHHMLPFFGTIHIGYIPNERLIGLSKLPRLVEIFSRRLQNQERLTSQIAYALHELIRPKGVGVIVEAKHLCMMARGVEKTSGSVITSSLIGLFKNRAKTRSEFLRLIKP